MGPDAPEDPRPATITRAKLEEELASAKIEVVKAQQLAFQYQGAVTVLLHLLDEIKP